MLVEKLEKNIKKYSLFKKNTRLLVAVSGGSDSTCLCYLLNLIKDKYNFDLFVAHLNHSLRSYESERDQEFVRSLAKQLDLRFITKKINIKNVAHKKKMSIEEAAREERYKFLFDIAIRYNIKKIIVGHTMDDQIETVMMHILRGTGLRGLAGMKFVTSMKGFTVVRPLLNIPKHEIMNFLKKNNIAHVEDSSNSKPVFFRNRVRLHLIPYITKNFSQHFQKNLFNLSEIANFSYDYIADVANHTLKSIMEKRGKVLALGLKEFKKLHKALQTEVVSIIFLKFSNGKALDKSNIDDIIEHINREKTLSLPSDIFVSIKGGSIIFSKNEKHKKLSFLKNITLLKMPGTTKLCDLNLSVTAKFIKRYPRETNFACNNEAYYDYDKLQLPLYVRTRKASDKFIPFGMSDSKKLKKFFIDEKILYETRSRVPLVFAGNDMIWIAGIRRSNIAPITVSTKKILLLKIKYGK